MVVSRDGVLGNLLPAGQWRCLLGYRLLLAHSWPPCCGVATFNGAFSLICRGTRTFSSLLEQPAFGLPRILFRPAALLPSHSTLHDCSY